MRSFDQRMARLTALVALGEAAFKADPLPVLRAAQREMIELRKVLDRVDHALSPDIVFETAEHLHVRPSNIQGEAYIRCEAAKKVLREYRSGKQ